MNLSRVLTGLLAAPAAIAALDLANPQWSWVEVPASNFVGGRSGWLLSLAAIGAGLASAAMIGPIGARSGGRRAVRWLLGVWATGMIIAGMVPADPPERWDDRSAADTVHGIAALTAFLVLPIAATLLTRAWWRDPPWRRWRALLAVTAAATVAGYAAFLVALVDVMGGPELGIGPYATLVGLLERTMLWSYVGWLACAAVAASRIAPATRAG
ncbi:DUF998 domain-containing protein [Actinoplanes friuliensis]|uniref:DUF998 domain-containing protein n=1 Tax=Actinoplanes friuliensis TaxID=196914 RepID=UPI000694949D|nr:DUF998 domain-containing protein [Actinoplanes friuliensis]